MSTSSSLSALPVELIHYLFQYLDISTILFSFRYVCKRFHAIVNSFDRYKLDMRLISKHDFDHLCHLISPTKIHSIILSNNNNTPHQIRIFLSRFSFDRFSRLRSLSLIKIEENNLFSILMHLSSQCSLQSLTIDCSSWDTFSYTIRVLLSSTIVKSKLEKLDLNISYRDLDTISWPPLPITLKYLRLQHCTFQEYCMILRRASNLQKLKLTECLMYNFDHTIYQPMDNIYPLKLVSISLGACFMRMKELLIFLSHTPRLQYLKLIIWTDSSDSVIDGNKWENFITNKLPCLSRFEFFFDDLTHLDQESVNIQSYLQPFQTPFWIEHKHWYVMCDYVKTVSMIRLYSLPMCHFLYTYYADSRKISDSTWKTTENQMRLVDRVRELNLNLNEIVESVNEIQNNPFRNSVFSQVTHLSLNLDGRYSHTSLPFLRTIVDFSSIIRLSMQLVIHSFDLNSLLICYISSILKETSNMHSLRITLIQIEEPYIHIETICSIIPRSVKHLQISIINSEEIKCILEQLPQLSSVTFYSPNISNYYDDIKEWIQLRRKDSLYRKDLRCVHIWLGALINNDREKHSKKRGLHRLRRTQSYRQ